MSTFGATERTSARYTATLKDSTGVVLPLALIVTAKLTLTDVDTNTVINSRDAQDVKNANDVTIHATSGLLTWSIQPEDNIIMTPTAEYELHHAVFDVVYSTDQRVVHEVHLLVENISRISA